MTHLRSLLGPSQQITIMKILFLIWGGGRSGGGGGRGGGARVDVNQELKLFEN